VPTPAVKNAERPDKSGRSKVPRFKKSRARPARREGDSFCAHSVLFINKKKKKICALSSAPTRSESGSRPDSEYVVGLVEGIA